jgi:hypothetical protein
MTTLQMTVGERFATPEKKWKKLNIIELLKKLGIPAIMLGLVLAATLIVGSVIVGMAGHYGRIMNQGSINGQIELVQAHVIAPNIGGKMR